MKKQRCGAVRKIGQALLLVLLAGCASVAALAPAEPAAPTDSPAPAAVQAGPTQPLAAPTAAGTAGPAAPTAALAPPGDRLYLTGEDGYGVSRLFVLNSATGQFERTLPRGYISPDWSTLYQVAPVLSKTDIRAYDVATGRLLRETSVNGLYDAPAYADGDLRNVFSPDGRWLVLFEQVTDAEQQQWEKAGRARTRIQVLDTSFTAAPRHADLDGFFTFDALAAGGDSLYLIEMLGPGWPPKDVPGQPPHYQVRRYDLAAGRLDEQPVVDKTEVGPMTGSRFTSVASRDGALLYSLYTRQSEGPFVHVLNLNDRYAVCVDLPFPPGPDDFESAMMWSLALTPDQGTLYAVNAALGQVAAVNTQTFEVRSATLPAAPTATLSWPARIAGWLAPAAEAKRLVVGGAALSPDGQTLYAVDANGLVAIATSDLSLRGRFMDKWTLNNLALSPRGDALYVVSDERGALLRLALPAAGASPVRIETPGRPGAVLRVTDLSP